MKKSSSGEFMKETYSALKNIALAHILRDTKESSFEEDPEQEQVVQQVQL